MAKAFLIHWVFVYGPPKELLSDNGPQFRARLFQAICKIVKTKNIYTLPYHPQTNGQTERMNRTLAAMLRHYVAEEQRSWDFYAPIIVSRDLAPSILLRRRDKDK